MAKGIALSIGLNAVDSKHYGGWSGDLTACEADAEDMAEIARSRGFAEVKTLLTTAAKRSAVLTEIKVAAGALGGGDIFMLTYSGHGGQLPDENNDENDGQDETWCLFDGELVDDEIYKALGDFEKGVRILVLSDSCHSGTVTKAAYYQGTAMTRAPFLGGNEVRYRAMPPDVALRTYRQNKKFYDPILRDAKLAKSIDGVTASVILISGCQDNQFSADGAFNGLFTGTLLMVWNDGRFTKGYTSFHKAIVKRMPPDQTPNFFFVGTPNRRFRYQQPFTV
jgi:hypothetical protein